VSRREGGFGGFEANIGFAVLVLGNLYGDDQATASLPIKCVYIALFSHGTASFV
jgi:hypothetical protein